jgi:hypothetical protein
MLGRRFYQIRLGGRLDARFVLPLAEGPLEGAQVETDSDGTVLSGVCQDNSALFGLLDQIRDLGLDLLGMTSFAIAPASRHG